MNELAVIVQAGGKSSRMGQDKGLVKLAGKPLVEHVLERTAGLGAYQLMTTNRPAHYEYLGLPMASDRTPGAGALPGLATALGATTSLYSLVVACDMPFLNRDLLGHMVTLAPGADVVVPRWEGRLQPLLALYRRQPSLEAVEAALARGDRRMISFYDDLRIVEVSEAVVATFRPAGLSFFNVNTPADLARAEAIWREENLTN